MNIQGIRLLKRGAVGLLLVAGLGGCAVYGPPYAGNDPYYGGGGYSTYYGAPVELNLGLGYYGGSRHGNYRRDGWGHGRSHGGGRRGRH
ncbi:hypothetical protein [Massilia yuzhufengensis]|uniref:Lipoprotein n=1 Tax=Massilia yuzhufengensis TaxID=1164594 RepID=A0A1I1IEE2_9BURK|nr:hypothetical protein [Massilia yuzhufengensis]SFC32073.1 hypothetical protein SAMN05216204_105113 [Massilia yuzhufengensis]